MYPHPDQPIKIFLADDSREDCMRFGKALSEINVHTRLTVVSNGEQMLQVLDLHQALPPDIIFMDIGLPEKNGYESLDEIRANPAFRDIPVILMSDSEAAETVNKAYKHDASLYLCKPDSFPKLREMIRRILAMEWDISFSAIGENDFYMA